MERPRLFSHAEAERVLRRAGYSKEEIQDLLRDFPDPIDADRDADALMKHGVTWAHLTDRMGGSP